MLEAANGGGDLGCAKAVVETRGAPEPEWDGAYEPAERLVDPSRRLMYRVVSRTTEDCGGDDETWSSKQDELWRIRSDSSIFSGGCSYSRSTLITCICLWLVIW